MYKNIDLCYCLFRNSAVESIRQNIKSDKNYRAHRKWGKSGFWSMCDLTKNHFEYLKLASDFISSKHESVPRKVSKMLSMN